MKTNYITDSLRYMTTKKSNIYLHLSMKEDEERGARREPWLSNDYFVIVLPTALDILLVLCLDLIDPPD